MLLHARLLPAVALAGSRHFPQRLVIIGEVGRLSGEQRGLQLTERSGEEDRRKRVGRRGNERTQDRRVRALCDERRNGVPRVM
eukprot:6571782-Prymnesium_polylepis.1